MTDGASAQPLPAGGASERSDLARHWPLVVIGMVGIGLGFPGLAFYTIGIFAPTLAREFGWGIGDILAGLGFAPFILLGGGPLIGALIDRVGTRVVASVALTGLGVSYASLALSSGSLAQYYASWLLLSLFGLGATTITFTRPIADNFERQRGLALGIAMAGVGLFALVVKPFAALVLGIAGWRVALLAIASLPIIVGVPLALACLPRGGRKRGDASRQGYGLTAKEAFASRPFWTLLLTFVPLAFALGAPLPNLETILASKGFAAGTVVALGASVGAALIVGRIAGGWLIDRLWAPGLGAALLIAGAGACWMLSLPHLDETAAMAAILVLGFAGGLEVDLLAFLIARYLGTRAYGTVYGAVFGAFALGPSLGPGVLGYLYDWTGSYALGFRISAALLVLCAAALMTLGRYPRFEGAPEHGP